MADREIGRKTDMSAGVVHCRPDCCEYSEADIYGTRLLKSPVFEGDHDVRSAFFRMRKGDVIAKHMHKKWVQVAVQSGSIEVRQGDDISFIAGAGTVYFLDPGFFHIETAIEDTLILVTQGEDRPGWLEGRATT